MYAISTRTARTAVAERVSTFPLADLSGHPVGRRAASDVDVAEDAEVTDVPAEEAADVTELPAGCAA